MAMIAAVFCSCGQQPAQERGPRPVKLAEVTSLSRIEKSYSGVCVLGVFAGEEKDLPAEKKIFGKDFAYIHNVNGFSKVVGRYLIRQLEKEE